MQSEYKKYTELSVWLEAKRLTVDIYKATQTFPKQEQFGLVNQIRRCAVSVPSNIAEGAGEIIQRIAYISFILQEARFMNWKHKYI